MSAPQPNPRPSTLTEPGVSLKPGSQAAAVPAEGDSPDGDISGQLRDIAEVPAVEIITTLAIHLMSAAAVKCGLGEEGEAGQDLDEARKLITALAGLVVTSAPDLGTFHAAPLRDGLRSLQLAFREAATYPDPPGRGPGEALTGPVS